MEKQSYSVSIEQVMHRAMVRPRYFTVISVECKVTGMKQSRAVIQLPLLYRLRLKLNLIAMLRCVKKYRKFAENNF